jgi:ligand-binding sensor domain-containing protein
MAPHVRPLVLAAGLVCMAVAPRGHALDPTRPLDQYSHAAWHVDQGLPQNTVQAIAQTRDGFLWLGTAEGLARFDGERFVILGGADVPELGASDIQFLHEDREGRLWIGVYGVGLVVRDVAGFHAVAPPAGADLSSVVAIAEDSSGTLWVGGDDGRLYRVEGRVVQEAQPDDPTASVRALAFDGRGRLWIGTSAGLAVRSGGETRWFTRRDGLASEQITALAVDGGAIWLGTTDGLQRIEDDVVRPPASGEAVRALLLDPQRSLWVGYDRGLVRIAGGTASPLLGDQVLSDDAIRSLAGDRDGSLWVGTFAGGLNQLKDGTVVTYTRAHGLPRDEVGVVAPARQAGVWFASGLGAVGHAEGDTIRGLPPLPQDVEVWALHEDAGGRLWAGTERGLARLERGRWRHYGAREGVPEAGVAAVYVDSSDRVWIGYDSLGVARLEDGRVVRLSSREGLPSDQIRAFLEGRDGRLWIATYGGLVAVRGDALTTYTTRHGLSHNLVRALHEDAEGVLWIGSYGGGLTRFKDGRLSPITSRHGLFSDVIYAVVEDARGSLWMSCNRGVFSVPKGDLDAVADGRAERVSPRVYGRSDGMLSVECNGGSPGGARSVAGRLWFPTERGLVAIDPQVPQHRATPPLPVFEQVYVAGRAVPLGPVRLAAGARRLRFEFASPDFLAPDRLAYVHRMEGFEDEWLSRPRRSAEYTNLPPGDYRFVVRVSDAVGRAGEVALPVSVSARFWQTRGFAAAALLGAVLFGYAGYRWRVRALRASEAELKRRVEAALADVRVLSGLLPICANCKKIRDDKGYWSQIESYIHKHSEAQFTHGICPECAAKLYPGLRSAAAARE